MKAIVTGAAAGIGMQVAARLAQRGDRVYLCDIAADGIEKAVVETAAIGGAAADVADEAQVDDFMKNALDALGGLDLLVNTAGIAGPTGAIESLGLADWQDCLWVTLDGSFLMCRHAASVMKNQGAGSIVNFASTAGLYGYPNRTPYATAKWGVIGLSKSLAMELGPFGIRVNAICPGPVEGERMDRVIEMEAENSGRSKDEVREIYARSSSLRAFVTTDDIAEMILFLSSPAGAKISGQALAVDGHTEYLTG